MPDFEQRIRTRLLLDHPFYGTLALHLPLVPNRDIPTMRTDGTRIQYNPEFVEALPPAEQLGLFAHEIDHCALLHMYRRGDRDPKEWNEACDFVVNGQLLDSGFTIPPNMLVDRQFDGMSAEQVYSKRRSQKQEQPNDEQEQDSQGDQEDEGQDDDGQTDESQDAEGDGEGQGESEGQAGGGGEAPPIMGDCPSGDFVDGPTTAEQPGELTEQDWEILTEEAALVATRAGDLPGDIALAIKKTREPRVDWIAETRSFITNTVASDLSWSRPNRRFVWKGLYFPGERKENVGQLLCVIDTSGSVTQEQLNDAARELTGLISEVRPEGLTVLYVDTEVRGVVEFVPDDEIELTAVGRGGTRFQPAFNWVEKENREVLACLYFTDLEGPAPVEPSYPTLWITPAHVTKTEPFGSLVRMP